MLAYVVGDIAIRDEERIADYRPMVTASLERHGGRYLVRGAAPDALEASGWAPERLVVIEFDSLEAARGWYDSADYREARQVRKGAATVSLVLAPGA